MKNDIEAGAPEGLYSVEMGLDEPRAWGDDGHRADRIWLAGMAMQALIGDGRDMYNIARQAWAMADAMLATESN